MKLISLIKGFPTKSVPVSYQRPGLEKTGFIPENSNNEE